jgi:hypothetical protein
MGRPDAQAVHRQALILRIWEQEYAAQGPDHRRQWFYRLPRYAFDGIPRLQGDPHLDEKYSIEELEVKFSQWENLLRQLFVKKR